MKQGQFAELLFVQRVTFVKALLHVLATQNISRWRLLPFAVVLIKALLRVRTMMAYGISYYTITPQGKPVLASGVVYVPTKGKMKGVIEVSPLTRSKIDCATRDTMSPEVFPSMLGYVCIIPDLIGCGVSEELPIAYLQHENVALVQADMRHATEQFLKKKHNFTLPRTSILFGYSLGASGIWALARHYQLHPELDVHVSHIFAGGGAYYPDVVLRALHKARYSDYAIMPNILYSMNYYDKLNLDFNEIFKGKLLKNYKEWCLGKIPIPEMTTMLGTRLDKYINFKFFSDDNPAFRRMMEVVTTKSIPEDWVPRAKVHLLHSKRDTYVPIASFWALYGRLKRCNASVDYRLVDYDHVPAAVPFVLGFMRFLMNHRTTKKQYLR